MEGFPRSGGIHFIVADFITISSFFYWVHICWASLCARCDDRDRSGEHKPVKYQLVFV